MNLKSAVATATLSLTILGATGTLAHAAPVVDAPPRDNSVVSTDIVPGVHYTSDIVDRTVVISTSNGSFRKTENSVQIVDARGGVVAKLPLRYQIGNRAYPIEASIAHRSLTLTPVLASSAASQARSVSPTSAVTRDLAPEKLVATVAQTRQQRDAAALGMLVQQVTIASIVGSMIGTIAGAGIGCLAGLAVGAAATAPVAWLLGAGPVAGCIGGGVLLAPVGALAGTIAIGGPILAVSLFQYFQAVSAPLN
ncbi:hypothetical protein [Gordonia sp. NPDC127522]|uniref:hypothetical protein n=1 Tax=Gordonia sp. NPDC127522 TaxID=3345390 RepID=UPI00362554F2